MKIQSTKVYLAVGFIQALRDESSLNEDSIEMMVREKYQLSRLESLVAMEETEAYRLKGCTPKVPRSKPSLDNTET